VHVEKYSTVEINAYKRSCLLLYNTENKVHSRKFTKRINLGTFI